MWFEVCGLGIIVASSFCRSFEQERKMQRQVTKTEVTAFLDSEEVVEALLKVQKHAVANNQKGFSQGVVHWLDENEKIYKNKEYIAQFGPNAKEDYFTKKDGKKNSDIPVARWAMECYKLLSRSNTKCSKWKEGQPGPIPDYHDKIQTYRACEVNTIGKHLVKMGKIVNGYAKGRGAKKGGLFIDGQKIPEKGSDESDESYALIKTAFIETIEKKNGMYHLALLLVVFCFIVLYVYLLLVLFNAPTAEYCKTWLEKQSPSTEVLQERGNNDGEMGVSVLLFVFTFHYVFLVISNNLFLLSKGGMQTIELAILQAASILHPIRMI
mgnify:CR=1 FL=1